MHVRTHIKHGLPGGWVDFYTKVMKDRVVTDESAKRATAIGSQSTNSGRGTTMTL